MSKESDVLTLHEIDQTLCEIYKVIADHMEHKENRYNIFKVLEIEHKEVLMCRVLTDFLSPSGFHNQGAKYLRIFLKDILKMDKKEAERLCDTAHVLKEYPITQDRRIDIVILAKDTFIPIEVKIHAGEQKAQCYDYFRFAEKKGKTAKIIYLTKWGTMPGSYSMQSADGKDSLQEKDVICLSFAEDICRFMDLLMEKETDAVIKETARQYKEAVQAFTMFVDEELTGKVSERLLESETNFRSMLAIEQSADKAKAALIYKVMAEMEESLEPLMKKYGFEKESRFSWSEYQEKAVEEYYKQKESTYPGINYVVKNAALTDGIELWFRVEIDYALFAGFCLFDTQADAEWGKGNKLDFPDEKVKTELSNYLNLQEAVYDAWWVQWWYLPTASDDKKIDTEQIPDFKAMNEVAVVLADDNKRKEFIKRAGTMIDRKLEKIMKQVIL